MMTPEQVERWWTDYWRELAFNYLAKEGLEMWARVEEKLGPIEAKDMD